MRAYSLHSSKRFSHLSPSFLLDALNLYTFPAASPSPISKLNLCGSVPFLPYEDGGDADESRTQ